MYSKDSEEVKALIKNIEEDVYFECGWSGISGSFVKVDVTDTDEDSIFCVLREVEENPGSKREYSSEFTIDRETLEVDFN